MDYKILSLATPEKRDDDKGYNWYAVDPAVVYPETVKRILDVLQSGELPQELVDDKAPVEIDPRSVARQYLAEARSMPEKAWEWSLTDRTEFKDPEQITARAAALELARRWFTQALHVAVGGSLGVHILKDERFKL